MIDYKKIFKSRDLRIKILSGFSFVPDRWMIQLQYWLHTGKLLHLNNPVLFSEKLQLYKLNYRNPDMLRCTDKVEVRKYMEEKGFAQNLVPVYGIYDDLDRIDFDKLPQQFVAKTSDGGGGHQVYVCRDKSKEDPEKLLNLWRSWMEAPKPKKHIAREWAYDNGFKRKLIIEKLLVDNSSPDKDIRDYKFLCFNGKYKSAQVDVDRYHNHLRGFLDENLNHLKDAGNIYPNYDDSVKLPENINEMVAFAETLAKDFPFVRVDLYSVEGKIYFSEMTFYPSSGYALFSPLSFDRQLGDYFEYPSEP